VRKTKAAGMRVLEMPKRRSSLNQDDSFILDVGKKLYVWDGAKANPFEKYKAITVANKWADERDGRATVTKDIDDKFWGELGGEGEIKEDADDGEVKTGAVEDSVLYQVSDNNQGAKLTCIEVGRGKLDKGMLCTDDVMMLDAHGEIFLWVGKGANAAEGRSCYGVAFDFLSTNKRSQDTPIHRFKQGQAIQNPQWAKAFGA